LFLLAVIFGGGYFLFFGPAPAIEVIAPVQLEAADTIAKIDLNAGGVVNSPVLKTFKQYGIDPGVGTIGRQNPFLPL
jgi:hypothetical protein